MKFKTQVDKIQYDLLNLNEGAIRKRLFIKSKKIDRKKSKLMRDHWRRNKANISKGIKKWHKSTQGKRFHRALGRFNALREGAFLQYHYYNEQTPKEVNISIDDVNNALLSLSSIETHLFLELQYYEANSEALSEFLSIIYQFVDDSSFLKESLLESYISGSISGEDYILLNDIIQFFQDPKAYMYEKRTIMGLSNDENSQDSESLKEQLNYIKNIDLMEDSNIIYEKLDELLEK